MIKNILLTENRKKTAQARKKAEINKKGGGVALYVDKNLKYKRVGRMMTVIDGVTSPRRM